MASNVSFSGAPFDSAQGAQLRSLSGVEATEGK